MNKLAQSIYKIYPSSMKLAIFNLRTVINPSLFRGCDVNLSYNGRSLHVYSTSSPPFFEIQQVCTGSLKKMQGLLKDYSSKAGDCDRSLFS